MQMEVQDLAEKKKRRELKLKNKNKYKSCQMHNRDQLTWQMEVTGVTGRTWTCGGNGGGINYVRRHSNVMTIFFTKEGRNWNVIRNSWMIILNGTFISNKQLIMLQVCYAVMLISQKWSIKAVKILGSQTRIIN